MNQSKKQTNLKNFNQGEFLTTIMDKISLSICKKAFVPRSKSQYFGSPSPKQHWDTDRFFSFSWSTLCLVVIGQTFEKQDKWINSNQIKYWILWRGENQSTWRKTGELKTLTPSPKTPLVVSNITIISAKVFVLNSVGQQYLSLSTHLKKVSFWIIVAMADYVMLVKRSVQLLNLVAYGCMDEN